MSFTQDVFEARKTLMIEWASVPDEHRATAAQLHERYIEKSRGLRRVKAPPDQEQVLRWVVAANSDAWTAVRKKWRLGGLIGVDFFVQLLGAYRLHGVDASLTGSTEEMARTLQKHPEPIYQKTYLLDLPTEILHWIMSLANKRDAMCLGSACHRLHQIATSYIFEASFRCSKMIFACLIVTQAS
jgi:hypothetical protein